VTSRWVSPGTPVSSTNKTDCHDITEILLKVALNTIALTLTQKPTKFFYILLISTVIETPEKAMPNGLTFWVEIYQIKNGQIYRQ
jgi:hypothetical protein